MININNYIVEKLHLGKYTENDDIHDYVLCYASGDKFRLINKLAEDHDKYKKFTVDDDLFIYCFLVPKDEVDEIINVFDGMRGESQIYEIPYNYTKKNFSITEIVRNDLDRKKLKKYTNEKD